MDLKGNRVTWLGHGTWLWETSDGKRIMVDPWLSGNPSCPDELKDVGQLDTILVTHGHFDHIGDLLAAAGDEGPTVVAIFETGAYLQSQGVQNIVQMNKGGTVTIPGGTVTMVHAIHSGGILHEGQIIEGGDAAGYVLRLNDGLCVYHAGDTDVFTDMAIIGQLDKPDIAVLPIGDHFTMGPSRAAHAVKLLGVKQVLCGHWGTFPVLVGRPSDLQKLVARDVEVADIQAGDSLP